MIDRGVARALIDPEGLLVHGDDALLALNARAGGAPGQPLAHGKLATVARLVQRLGVPVSRRLTLADADSDLDIWVRAAPDPEGVALALSGWEQRRIEAPAATRAIGGLTPADPDERWETDAAMRLTAIAPAAVERFALDAAALIGRPITQAFHLAEDAGGDFPILTALGLRQGFARQPATLKAGGSALVELAGEPKLDSLGGFIGYAGTVRPGTVPGDDATLPAGFATKLERALRTPLGRIVANADSIQAQAEGPLRQDYVDYAGDIASAGRHLIGLVEDLADLQAIERPDFAVIAEPLDLADVARRAAGLLGVRAADAGVRIDRPAANEALPVIGEFRRALQVLVNLIGNAVRYSPRGGVVWVRIVQEDGFGVVIVADQGKGIDPDDQARIFEKFERVDASEQGGSGLGLYIARRLARAMGGELTVDSAPGQGARFVFTLPSAA